MPKEHFKSYWQSQKVTKTTIAKVYSLIFFTLFLKNFSLKSLTKNVNAECAKRLKELKLKNAQWTIKNATTRKRLGRGKFEPHEESVLTPSELPASLRCLTTASSSLIQG